MSDLTDVVATAAIRLLGYRSRWVATDVGRVHVLHARGGGELPGVAVLHGFSSAAAHYFPLMFGLRKHVKEVSAPDFPAHGLSEIPRKLEAGSVRRGLFAALDAMITEPSVIIGNCIGGFAALEYARERAAKVRGLVLISPFGGPSSLEEMADLRAMFDLASHASALHLVDRCFQAYNPFRHLYALDIRLRFQRPEVRRLLSAIDMLEVRRETLAGITVPTLIIWGLGDRVLPGSSRDYFRRHLPGHARFEEPLHFGHIPFLDHPYELSHRILRFMREEFCLAKELDQA